MEDTNKQIKLLLIIIESPSSSYSKQFIHLTLPGLEEITYLVVAGQKVHTIYGVRNCTSNFPSYHPSLVFLKIKG